jgi:hypothetical protein
MELLLLLVVNSALIVAFSFAHPLPLYLGIAIIMRAKTGSKSMSNTT